MALREDIYGGGPQNDLLRYWLAMPISRQIAEKSLTRPTMAPVGSFILRRSESHPGNYALTVVEGRVVRSYKITDLGCGQVGIETGQAFASLEHMLEYFYDKPFPRAGEGHVPLTIMHQELIGLPPMPSMPVPTQTVYDSVDEQPGYGDAYREPEPYDGSALPPRARVVEPFYEDEDAPAPPPSRAGQVPRGRPPAGLPVAQPTFYGDANAGTLYGGATSDGTYGMVN